ncbi:MAG: hypothetical protein WD625_01510, partial [Balneolales bacterium]
KNKLHLHIGSPKTGTTSIQSTLFKNRTELENQKFCYPGNNVNHHAFFFTTKSTKNHWPRQFKGIDKPSLNKSIKRFFSDVENDFKKECQHYVISTEYLFIDDKEAIKNTIDYLKHFFSEVIVYVFVRNPIEYYTSFQQQMIKARSFVTPPGSFNYSFKSVIEAWSEFYPVQVTKYDQKVNSCEVFCGKIGIDYGELTDSGQGNNTSLSIEQLAVLEKIQRNIYPDKEDIFKPHLGVIQNIKAPFTNKPILKKSVKQLIYNNHKKQLEWLKREWNIDFSEDQYEGNEADLQNSPQNKASVRDIFNIDEPAAERYEALIIDALLRQMVKKK